jgi:hypothetical protein
VRRVFDFCNNHWFWVFRKNQNQRITNGSGYFLKKTRINELPGPGGIQKRNQNQKISDKCPEPANSLVLIIRVYSMVRLE